MNTSRVLLSKFATSDWLLLHQLDNDPMVMKYINGGVPASEEHIKDKIIPLFTRYDDVFHRFGFWKLSLVENFDFVGWVCLRPTAQTGQARLGYRLKKEFWGYGLATEVAAKMVEIGFSECGLQSVVATTYEENLGSQRVLEKLGFNFSKRLKVDFSDAETTVNDPSVSWESEDIQYILEKRDWKPVYV
ncbi:MAG: GNAT family N-acetyltransferase [Pseudomonadales bacterium]|nr:GNAT family N-acetyltransferase [Pseudomonadales bacterium]